MNIYSAIARGGIEDICSLIQQGEDINKVSSVGFTPLVFACMKSRIDIVKFLLEKGADPNLPIIGGSYPLTTAVGLNDIQMVKLLVHYGANVHIHMIRYSREISLLDVALNITNIDMIRLFCNHGVEVMDYDHMRFYEEGVTDEYDIQELDLHTCQTITSILKSRPRSLYQKKDRSHTYMSNRYSDTDIIF